MNIEHATFLIGKILLGGFFILSGLKHFTETRELTDWTSSKGLPAPKILVYLSGILISVSGLGILLGAFTVTSIALLATFLILASVSMHDYWNLEENRQEQKTNFLKNTALLGALLMLLRADWTIYGLGLTLGLL